MTVSHFISFSLGAAVSAIVSPTLRPGFFEVLIVLGVVFAICMAWQRRSSKARAQAGL